MMVYASSSPGSNSEIRRLVQQLAKDEEAKAEARLVGELIRDATSQVRFLAKGLTPVQLDANGLMSALEELITFSAATN